MPITSVYEFTCVCGQNFQTEDPHEIQCPFCGRTLTVEWRRPPGRSRTEEVEEVAS
jgi:DNA-directed RNA polymerase subunit RPC12/RpoP